MANAELELSRIRDFLDNLNLKNSANTDSDDVGKDIYKKFHALLSWQTIMNKHDVLKEEGAFDEFLSDSAASYFFLLTSAYKPAIAMLRSSVENLLRSILVLRGVEVSAIEAVWELFAVARSHFLGTGEDWVVIRVDALHIRYGEMCKTVHSTSLEYMSLRIPFERIFEFDAYVYGITRQLVKDVFRVSSEALYLVLKGNLADAHYRVADEIRDALSPSTKALVSQ